MAIPSKDDFLSFLRMGDGSYEAGNLSQIARSGYEGIQAFVHCVEAHRESLAKNIELSAVSKWIDGNPTSVRAVNALNGKSSNAVKSDPQAYWSRVIDDATRIRNEDDYYKSQRLRKIALGESWDGPSLTDYLNETNSERARFHRIHNAISRYQRWPRFSVLHGVGQAFFGYFYDESYRRHSVKADARRFALDKLTDAISQLGDSTLWQAAGIKWKPTRGLITQTIMLEDAKSEEPNPAIKKLDETAAERALAYELWSLFRRNYRANKTSAIFNYLQFEGVKNAPDSRSVERWVKDWRDRKVRLAPTHK